MTEQQDRSTMGSDIYAVEGPPHGVPYANGPRPSNSTARARLVDGDIAGARIIFDDLATSQKTNPELLLTEALLLEAEGRLDDALSRLSRIVAGSMTASTRAGVQSHTRIARLATRLGRAGMAETSGKALLALNSEDIDGLRALAFAQQSQRDTEAWLRTTRRMARASNATEMDVWAAIEAFEGLGQWDDVLELIDRHEFELDPWRMTPLRIRALIEQGWQRLVLERLRTACADEYIHAQDAFELMVRCGALALAARFIEEDTSRDFRKAEARASILAIASRTSTSVSFHEAPLQFVDALQAQDILMPGREPIESAVARALLDLTRGAARLLAGDDPAGAVRMLVAALRLAPADRTLLDSLVDAAHRANLTQRYLDTLLRIWTTHRDAAPLLATAHEFLETSSSAMISSVMTTAVAEAGSLGLDISVVVVKLREQACRKIDDHIREGDVAAGLELMIGLSRRLSIDDWPGSLVTRLLRATKRRLRRRRSEGGALTASLGTVYLELVPQDVDICRMLARVRLRQRHLGEARRLLERVLAIDPHVAGDWAALAIVQHELEDFEGRDASVARALVIAPDQSLPPELSPVRQQMGLA